MHVCSFDIPTQDKNTDLLLFQEYQEQDSSGEFGLSFVSRDMEKPCDSKSDSQLDDDLLDDDDDDDEADEKKESSMSEKPANPERLKAFNVSQIH